MRIAFIGQKGIPALSGGVEKHVENVAVRMAQEGHDVSVYVRSYYTDPSLKEYKGVKLLHMPSIRTKNLDAITHTFLSTLHALFGRYDVIHYQSVGPTTLSFIPMLLTRKTKVISTFHCRDHFHKKWGWFAKMYLKFGEYVSCTIPHKTIVVSKGLQGYALQKYGCEVALIPNGADVQTHVGSDVLNRFGLKENRYILSVGRLVKHKGVHYLINAFGQLEDTNKLPNNFKLVIVGKNAETPEYEEYLKMMSTGRENVMFLGERTGRELRQLFANAYLFVQPSESEGMSIALLEAMGYGLATVVSDIDPNVEVIADAGVIFENKNVDDLRDKLAYLLNRPEEAAALGAQAQQRVADNYSWDAIAQQTVSLYRSL
ncbi:MAG: glycosyltransferase family 4 protein [Candidatus Moranbacteria bacterium]|nr:glycosyltransferase family 4 protein [Candidatus Moranbacteria bacterium]